MSANILLVKLSSMGDVVHSFPALTEAAAQGHRFDWAVEEAFASLAAMHPAVDRVLPFGLRRWRKKPIAGLRELAGFVTRLRAQNYERVLDAQGLIKSALVSRASGAAIRLGLDSDSAREGAGARFYTEAHKVSWDLHAIDRLRQLFADSLGYTTDLSRAAPSALTADPSAKSSATTPIVLIHGTTWPSKEYPEAAWQVLAESLVARGHSVVFLSGSAAEHARAERLSGSLEPQFGKQATAVPPGSLTDACRRVMSAKLVIGVDSGLTHFAAVSGRPTLGLYGPTDAARTGVRGPRALDLSSDFGCAPCLQRLCTYSGPLQRLDGESLEPACFARISTERILSAADALLHELLPSDSL